MKIYNILLLSLLSSVAFSSCELQSEVYDKISTSVFPTNEADVDALLVGSVYAPFRNNQYEGLFTINNRGVQIWNDMCTDLMTCRWNDSWWYDMIYVNYNVRNHESSGLQYSNQIANITRMTNFIDLCEHAPVSDSYREQAIAQAKCGRGWLTYILYDFYGGLQFITQEALDNPLKSYLIPRSSAEETSRRAEEDLIAAAKVLPYRISYGSPEYGRFTRGAALTVLMHLYMHDKRWEDAAKVGEELQKPEYGYDLVPEYKDIFTRAGEGNKETIWACTEDHGINTHLWIAHVIPSEYPHVSQTETFAGYRVPWSFYHTFRKSDKRLEVLVGEYTSTVTGKKVNEKNPGTMLKLGALPVKYEDDPEDTGLGSAIDWIVLRYADVLTLQAEALARVAGAPTPEAIKLLNRVHQRAGLAAFTEANFTDLDSFLEAVLQERGWEGWGEGWRRPDLIRHGKFIEYARKYKNSRTAADHMVLMPLPQGFIDEGKGVVVQNPGY